jgi:type III pantothenate kinase
VTPDVVVDIGNTRIKWGWYPPGHWMLSASLPPDDPQAWAARLQSIDLSPPIRWAVASVHPERLRRFCDWVTGRGEPVLTIEDYRQLPLSVRVDEPDRVGIDRLLNAVGFCHELPDGVPGIIIDVGTAATVDLLDEDHAFAGGAILPGPRLMFESLHRQTAKLPLIELHQVPSGDPPGKNTRDAMVVGVMASLTGAADFLVRAYAGLCQKPPWVMMTGGALGPLADYHFDGVGNTMTSRTLTLEGIRLAAEALP